MDELVYWLALQNIKDKVDISCIPNMVNQLGSIQKVWEADKSRLIQLGWTELMVESFVNFANKQNLSKYEQLLYYIDQDHIKIITFIDEEYPKQLRESGTIRYQPPVILFIKGSFLGIKKCAGVVGNRTASSPALKRARQISRDLARSGYTIVSGLARGIDTEAHRGALEASNGKTVATLAWMNPIYPPENIELAKEIEKSGAVISELYRDPAITTTDNYSRSRFVVRNRIISGLSNFIIAIESGQDGGTIRQVELALAQKKPVYVLEPEDLSNQDKGAGYKRIVNMGGKSIGDIDDLSNLLNFT
jgi:DNA processing protein